MGRLVDSTERGPGELILFGLGFVGFLLGVTGIVVGSVAAAIFGWALLLFVLACFGGRPRD